ncbi:Fibronectin type III domain-containing protein [Marinobacter daqiaonensis]|uniref:Fibronectin type III domain-containing protein n=1 Tax=Marinobacter daqiaonensis TaxID=650891 RepID=A0A1I6JFF5_9GAMM|nr:fibronectin type III domain-containing protein [Marinobacter daqiaonensis]SFR77685.1 Fibronectin type III domain-containing protein [Marinobacter daqiaonensis]
MFSRTIGSSRAGIASIVIAFALAGCGGGSTGSTSGVSAEDSPTIAPSEEASASSVSLSWTAPGTRVNGEQLSTADLDGYIVSYGQSVDTLDQSARVESCISCEFTVANLAEGTWYFRVQTVDTLGLVSEPSEPVSKTI